MSQLPDRSSSQPLSTSSARLVAVRMKSANKHIFRALVSLASANLLIRVMGMLNQVVVTARFGQAASMDAYFVASTLPVLLSQLLASALEASVIPVYARLRAKGGREQASRLFSTLLNILLISTSLGTILMLIFRDPLIVLTAPALKATSLHLAVDLAPYIFPVFVLMVMNSFMECLLNTEGQFGWPAYAGILVPITTASMVLVAGKSYGVLMLCLGTLAGQAIQLIAIIIRAHRAKIHYRPVLDLKNKELLAIAAVAWPALFSALISQASPIVDQMFASGLSEGSISVLNNALKLTSVPVGVIFASVGRAALPYLANQAANKDMKAFKGTLRLYLWAVGIGTLGLTAVMILLAHPIVQILFQRGAFTPEDTDRTSVTLVGFVIGLTPMAFGFITSRAFSALGKTRVLLYVTIFSVTANALFDYIFGRLWQSFGIALSTSAVYFCTMFILLITLRRSIGKLDLLTPPQEVMSVLLKLGTGQYPTQWTNWKEKYLSNLEIPYSYYQMATRALIISVTFLVGIIGTLNNALFTLRVAFGSLVILALLRYRYALLLTWIGIDALIGSTIPLFNGNNFLSGLTVPTLLLMLVVPIKPAFQRMPALAFLFAYLMWVFASIGISPIGIDRFLTLWIVYLAYVAIGVLVVQIAVTRRLLMGLIDAILLQALFISIYGIYGFFTKENGLYDTNISTLYRIGSVFAAPPTLAFFLSMIIPLAFYRTITLQGWRKSIGVLCTLVSLTALGMTFTRGAFISVPLSLILMIFFLPSKKLKAAMLGGIAGIVGLTILVGTLTNLPILGRFLNSDITTLNGRTLLWQALLDHFDPAQLLGNGLNAADVLLTTLQVGFGRGVIGTAPHNIFIGTLFDHGIIGVTLISLLLICIPWSLIATMRNATPEHRMILAMALAVFLNIFIQCFEVTVIWSQPVGVYVWIILALPFTFYWVRPKAAEEQETRLLAAVTLHPARPTESSEQELLSHV